MNKIFNNERPSNIKPETVFYGKITSDGIKPILKFTTGGYPNNNKDYGNQRTQVFNSSNTTVPHTRKNGIMFR